MKLTSSPKFIACAVWLVHAVAFASQGASPAAQSTVEFNRDVRPILSDNCFYCHGPDQSHRKAELRLDVREAALEKKAFQPGNAVASELVKRLISNDPDEVMPPPDSNKKLTSQQRDVLRRWIEQGAEYQQHWAYEKPVKAVVAPGENGVDVLVRKRLSSLGLESAGEADRRTLIRRLYFDLLGLPPAPEAVERFVKDGAPDAYARLVEEVLANPHHGERMAQGWLDVVRFADTIGYHSDNPRNVWPYRDWVIRSFNENKRFDRFTLEQVAGDLLPDASLETRVGSAFNRLVLSTEEGGAQPKDYEARMLTDRVRAIGAAWLGQTTGCAQCHDHKFDPFTTRDFYALGAFFADIKEGVIGRREDGMLVPTAAESKEIARLQGRLDGLRRELEADSPGRREGQLAWENGLAGGPVDVAWTSLVPEKLHADRGSKFETGADAVVSVSADGNAASDTYFVTVKTPPGTTTGFKLDALSSEQLPQRGPGRSPKGAFMLTQFSVKHGDAVLKVSEASATYEQKGFPAKSAIDGKPNDPKKGWSTFGNVEGDASIYFELEQPIVGEKTVTLLLRQIAGDNQTLGRFRVSATGAPKPVRAPAVQFPAEIMGVLKVPLEKRSEPQKAKLARHYRAVAPEFAAAREAITAAQLEQSEYEKNVAHCLVSTSSEVKRTVRILPRGNFMDESGEVVKPALPHYLPQPVVEGRDLTRLDLAQWLVSRENPLTARTVMNRLWKHFFGTGLSKVLDDLGAQGEPPPNAPLLDWLACEFVDSGWDFRHMVRTIVGSAAYRQVSTASPALLAVDPYNREHARQSAFRLDAESVRDNALAVSGLLVSKIGGPSAKPYQPERYWENLNFPTREYAADRDEGQYRRGVYTWWQRSFLHPSMLAFDAPSREECCAERTRSNIPQQALVLLNDPTYVEAARVLAARILAECDGDPALRMKRAFQIVLQREPRPEEASTMLALFEKHRAVYSADPKAAELLLKTGLAPLGAGVNNTELAAWLHVARVLLNLHETITRA
jgi:hypothetical protein